MLPVCTKAEYCHRHTEMTKKPIMYNHFIPPITLSCLICRHCWHMIRAYQQQNRYLASPWTSGRQNYGAMLPALWKNWTWPSSSWETSGQPAGEPEGCGERVLGIKTLQVDVFGQMLLWLKISTCFFLGGVPWGQCGLKRMSFTFPGNFAQFEQCLNGWQVVCYKHSWGQVQRPKKTCWPFWVSIQVPRSPWRSTAAFFRAWQVRMECNDLF